MYIRSGNIGCASDITSPGTLSRAFVFGMPVSEINVTGMITTHFTADNFITGGIFGIEGGILTTLVTLLGFYLLNTTTATPHMILLKMCEAASLPALPPYPAAPPEVPSHSGLFICIVLSANLD